MDTVNRAGQNVRKPGNLLSHVLTGHSYKLFAVHERVRQKVELGVKKSTLFQSLFSFDG